MAQTTKLLGQEDDLTSATNVGLKPLIRVHNTSTAAAVTVKNAGGTIVADVTLVANEVMNIHKQPSDTLEGGAQFLVVPIAFSN